jgi:hypothetical protein
MKIFIKIWEYLEKKKLYLYGYTIKMNVVINFLMKIKKKTKIFL